MKIKIVVCGILSILMFSTSIAEAGLWFHATRRAVGRKIMSRGFSISKAKPGRISKGINLSKSPATALKERPASKSIIVTRTSKGIERSALNTKRMTSAGLKKYSGLRDMRGTVHRGVIGPKLGRKIGQKAGHQGRAVIFQSAKDRKGTNLIVPKQTYMKHPRSLKPERVISYGR
jgi:hypothetical protein